jgi:hypothetical protein
MPAPVIVFGLLLGLSKGAAKVARKKGKAARGRKLGHKHVHLEHYDLDVTPEDRKKFEDSDGLDPFLRMSQRGRYIEHGV